MNSEEYLSRRTGLLSCGKLEGRIREKHKRKSHYRAASTITIVRGAKMMEVVEVEEGAEERSWFLQ